MAHILSVSYDEPLLWTRRLLLESQGYTVTSACGFEDGARCCRDGCFDLFVLGHSIPECDKDALIKEFRASCSAPIVSLRKPQEPDVRGADYHIEPDPESVLSLVAALVGENTAKSA